MYLNTKEDVYKDYCDQVAQYLTDMHQEGGCWEDSESNLTLALDRTSEFTASIYIMDYLFTQMASNTVGENNANHRGVFA